MGVEMDHTKPDTQRLTAVTSLLLVSGRVGLDATSQMWPHNKPIGEVVYHLTGRTREELLDDLPEQLRVVSGEFDALDVHLVAAAVERG
ncbi:MAG TPA: hypothetical protein VFL73_05390, partial [Solirubrobacteraceae bacterium]|nr:hypothetical protein [Solirubrobacteraceae bacterium]